MLLSLRKNGVTSLFKEVRFSRKGQSDENGENDEFAFYPLKIRASLFPPLQTTKMMKMVGVTQAKALEKAGFVLGLVVVL